MNWSTDGLIARPAKSLEYYQKREKELVPGQAEFKDKATDRDNMYQNLSHPC
jgi:hypothetical protein